MSGEATESYGQGLTPLQWDFLEAFFSRTDGFFLTGGAALVGFYGLHRTTNDLDLFTLDPEIFAQGDRYVNEAAAEIGASPVPVRVFPHFRRYVLQRDQETVDIDLVHESVPQWSGEKAMMGTVRVDPLEEIVVNKLCAVVGRAEVRDLWDLYHLLQRGYCLEQMLEAASTKDGGVDRESLTFVLSSLKWDALERAASRAGLSGFTLVSRYFRERAQELALGLLPPDRRG